jgi:hypothetical protein
MSGAPTPTMRDQLRTDLEHLDAGCRRHGLTVTMFRTAKYLFHVAVLLFTVYLIEIAGVEPVVATGAAVVLIAGPEGVEAWLVRQGVLAEADAERGGATDDA